MIENEQEDIPQRGITGSTASFIDVSPIIIVDKETRIKIGKEELTGAQLEKIVKQLKLMVAEEFI